MREKAADEGEGGLWGEGKFLFSWSVPVRLGFKLKFIYILVFLLLSFQKPNRKKAEPNLIFLGRFGIFYQFKPNCS